MATDEMYNGLYETFSEDTEKTLTVQLWIFLHGCTACSSTGGRAALPAIGTVLVSSTTAPTVYCVTLYEFWAVSRTGHVVYCIWDVNQHGIKTVYA